MEKNISKAKSAEAISLILRFINAHPEWTYMIEQLMMCDEDRLKALLKVKDIKLSEELINYLATTEDDLSVIFRVVMLVNNYFTFCPDTIEYAKNEQKAKLLKDSYERVGNSAILAYCSPQMDVRQMEETIKGLEKGLNNLQIKYYSDFERFSGAQMREIRKGFRSGLRSEEIIFMSESGFSAPQMRQIRKAIENTVAFYKVKSFAKVEYDEFQMENIRKVIEGRFANEYIDYINNPKFPAKQMGFIREAFESGVSLQEVKQLMELSEDESRKRLDEIQAKKLENL